MESSTFSNTPPGEVVLRSPAFHSAVTAAAVARRRKQSEDQIASFIRGLPVFESHPHSGGFLDKYRAMRSYFPSGHVARVDVLNDNGRFLVHHHGTPSHFPCLFEVINGKTQQLV